MKKKESTKKDDKAEEKEKNIQIAVRFLMNP
jgi:hypothetical protein